MHRSMGHTQCRASVIVPLYNSATTLPRAVRSVQHQTMQDFEIIIVDDGSRDRSLAEAQALAATDPRIQVIALPDNRGKPHAMNRAITQARGTWIAVLDADDWYEPDRLTALISTGESLGIPLVADNQRFWDADADVMVRTAFPGERGDSVLTREAFITGSDPYADFDFGMLKPVLRADHIHRISLAYRESTRLSEDFLYLFDHFAAGGIGYLLAAPLYNWTQSFGTISRRWTTTGAGDWRYDYPSALAAHADALNDPRTQCDPAWSGLLMARMRAFERLHRMTMLNRLRRSGAGLPRILLEAARHPSIWPQLLSRLTRA